MKNLQLGDKSKTVISQVAMIWNMFGAVRMQTPPLTVYWGVFQHCHRVLESFILYQARDGLGPLEITLQVSILSAEGNDLAVVKSVRVDSQTNKCNREK